jgi:DNA primase
MLRVHGYDPLWLKKIGLLEPRIFGDHSLVFILRDENGQSVGFSAKNLFYEAAEQDYEKAVKQYGISSRQAFQEKSAIPPKYFNSVQGHESRDGAPILWKGRRLFGFHRVKLGGAPLFIFDGYADVATAHMHGIRNSVAVSSAGTTTDQLELILRYKIPHVVLCLDADEGGWRGIQRSSRCWAWSQRS